MEELFQRWGVDESRGNELLVSLRDFIIEELQAGREVEFKQFMTIALKKTGDRQLRVPKTGEVIDVKSVPYARASFSPRFKNILAGRGGQTLPPGQPPADMVVETPQVTAQPTAIVEELPPPLPEELPPPLPVIPEPPPVGEKKYRLPDGSSVTESEARNLPPGSLIWHKDFGAVWKKVEEVFS